MYLRVVRWRAEKGIHYRSDRPLAETIEKRDPAVRYLDYDWSLNDR